MKFCDENSKSYFVNISKPEIASGLQPVLIHGREERKRAKALTDAANIMLHKEPSVAGDELENKRNNRLRRTSFSVLKQVKEDKKNNDIAIDVNEVQDI